MTFVVIRVSTLNGSREGSLFDPTSRAAHGKKAFAPDVPDRGLGRLPAACTAYKALASPNTLIDPIAGVAADSEPFARASKRWLHHFFAT